MMSIDLFKTILEYKSTLINSLSKKSISIPLYYYYRLKRYIYKNIIKSKYTVTYQFIYNLASLIQINHNLSELDNHMKNQGIMLDRRYDNDENLQYFSIYYSLKKYYTHPEVVYVYSIHPITSPGEIKFENIRIYQNKEVHGSKVFINSLELDPHKDNIYIKSAQYLLDANDKMCDVIKIFFEYYINECKKNLIEKRPILKLIWRQSV